MINRKATGLLVVLAALLVSVLTSAQTRPLAIIHANVVDVATGRVLPNSTVTISGTSITSVSEGGNPPAGARVIDAQNKFLIPGLWDMHSHAQATAESSLQLYVANGVTGIRDMGSDLDFILNMRASTASGRVLGPRIFAAGPILDDAPANWPFRYRVKTAEEGKAAVQMLKRRGVDLIKVHDRTPRDAYFAIVEEARRLNLPVAGHLPQGITAEQALEAGQGDIEHLSNSQLWRPCSGGAAYQAEKCKPFFAMLAQRSIWQTPTLGAAAEIATVGTPASEIPAEQLAYASQSLKKAWADNQGGFASPQVILQFRNNAKMGAQVASDMAKAGVPILAGCDSMIAGFCIHDELAAMVRGGMSPLAALQTATLNPAKYFKIEQTAGSIASGKRADLVLLDGNPLSDIANIARIRAVVLAGRLLDRTELDKTLADVKTRASKP